jgi:hypothetical protein
MYDSAGGLFPDGAKLRALYFNGDYAHKPYVVKRGQLWIDVLGDAARECSVLQVDGLDQAGIDAMVAKVPGWLGERNPVGRGIIYCNRVTLPAVMERAGDQPFDLWLATLDGTVPEVMVPRGNLLAVQISDQGNWDESVVVDKGFWDARSL